METADIPEEESEKKDLLFTGRSLKILICILFFIVLGSYHPADPSPFNLLWPANGLHNWFYLPGALFAGFFHFLFGFTAFLFPAFLLFLKPRREKAEVVSLFLGTMFIIMINMFLSLCFVKESSLLLKTVGSFGFVAHKSLTDFPGRLVSLLFLSGYLIRSVQTWEFDRSVFSLIFKTVASIFSLLLAGIVIVLPYCLKTLKGLYTETNKLRSALLRRVPEKMIHPQKKLFRMYRELRLMQAEMSKKGKIAKLSSRLQRPRRRIKQSGDVPSLHHGKYSHKSRIALRQAIKEYELLNDNDESNSTLS